MEYGKKDIKCIIAQQLKLVLETGTIRNLLEGMADHALNSGREDYEPCLNFNETRQTLETVGLYAKLVIDSDTKIEVAMSAVKNSEDDSELSKTILKLPNGVDVTLNELRKRGQ